MAFGFGVLYMFEIERGRHAVTLCSAAPPGHSYCGQPAIRRDSNINLH